MPVSVGKNYFWAGRKIHFWYLFFFLSYVYPICIGVTFKILWNNFIFLSQFWPTRNDFLRVQNRKKNDITNQEVFLKYIHTQSEYIRKTGKRYQGKRVLQQTYKKRTSGQNWIFSDVTKWPLSVIICVTL